MPLGAGFLRWVLKKDKILGFTAFLSIKVKKAIVIILFFHYVKVDALLAAASPTFPWTSPVMVENMVEYERELILDNERETERQRNVN